MRGLSRTKTIFYLIRNAGPNLNPPDPALSGRYPYHRYACKGLSCPGSEAALSWSSWVLRCEVEERIFRRSAALGSVKYSEPLKSFEHHLSRFPSVGMQHQIGKSIWQQISRFPAKTLRQGKFLRVRRFNDDAELEKIREQGMRNPDPRKCPVSGGRYNHLGQSFLHLSSDKETAVVETFENPGARKVGTLGNAITRSAVDAAHAVGG
jgi:hypothetical protein